MSAPSYSGSYTGILNGIPATLELRESGGSLEGSIADANGYRYTLQGNASGVSARGVLADPQQGGRLEFAASLSGDQLTLTLLIPDPMTGQTRTIAVDFQRSGSESSAPSPSPATEPTASGDPALVGLWVTQKIISDPVASLATEFFMEVRTDGTLLHGSGRMAGGSADWSVTGDPTGEVERARWRTENGIVYLAPLGTNQWVPYCRYYLEMGKLLLTFADGQSEVWYRR